MSTAQTDPEGQARVAAFIRALESLGWTVGRNVEIDVRWDAGDAKRAHSHAIEITAQTPDLIIANASQALSAVQRPKVCRPAGRAPSRLRPPQAAAQRTSPLRHRERPVAR